MLKLKKLAVFAFALLPIALPAQTPTLPAAQTQTASDHRADKTAIEQVMSSEKRAIASTDKIQNRRCCVRKKVPALLLFAALAISSANALTPVPRQQTSSIVPGARTGHNEALAHEITQLFNEDLGMISDLESAKDDPAFAAATG